MLQLTLESGFSLTTMLITAVVALATACLFYMRAFGRLRRGRWQLLFALRATAVAIVVLLLFRPVLCYYEELQDRPTLVFLVDDSASMGIADDDGGVTRLEQAKTALEQWWPRLSGDFQLNLLRFSDRATPVRDVRALRSVAPVGKATSLSVAMLAASQSVSKADKPTILLLSDGIHNSARNPVETAASLGIPVHTVGVGASLRNNPAYRDLRITGIDCPDRLMLNNKAKIVGMVEAIGLEGRVVRIALDEDDKTILEKELTLDNVEGEQRVEFELRPTVKGRHTYTVRAAKLNEEKIVENNRRSAVANVVEPGLRVLYVEGTLRGEYGAIADRFLAKDPDLEFCSLIQTRPNVFLKRSNMEGIDLKAIPSDAETIRKFDVFIIGDLDSSYFKPEQQRLILERVREGAGLIMLGGYHSLGPGGYASTPIGEALPVVLGGRNVGQVDEPFLPMLTPDGARHPIFANIADFFATKAGPAKRGGLPDLDGCTRVAAAKPGATVLAFHPTDANQMPVLAVQPVGQGRAAVFCGDTTRKWQQGPRALGRESPFLQFWGQMVRWLAGRSGAVDMKASIAGTTDKGYYEPEEPIRISAVVRDAKGEGAAAADVTAKITLEGRTEKIRLTAAAGPAGRYGAVYPPKRSGRYELVLEARSGELTLLSDKLVVDVGRADLEFEKLDMDEKMLTQIASAGKGRYFHLSTASSLLEQLDRSRQQKREFVKRPLYWPPGFWAAFVGVLTLEWVLRRRFQLR